MTADRSTLHKSKVEDFKRYLDEIGVTHRPGRGAFEILQVYRNDGQWFKLYSRLNMPEHVTVQGPLCNLVRAYLRDRSIDYKEEASNLNGTLDQPGNGPQDYKAEYKPADASTDDVPPWE